MLGRELRMRRTTQFQRALGGRRAARATLVVHLALSPLPPPRAGERPRGDRDSAGPPRIGLIVSRAVGGATTRSRVRRRLRHVAAARVHRLPAGSLVVLRALPPAATASSAMLGADLDAALRRVLAAPGPGR